MRRQNKTTIDNKRHASAYRSALGSTACPPASNAPTSSARASNASVSYVAIFLTAIASLPLAACSETITVHGQQFHDTDLHAIQPGMSQAQVRSTLGTPATTAVVDSGQAYYYISSTMAQSSFFLPDEQKRQIIAVYFNQGGTVDHVANYGLKDGKVFDFVSRTTPARGGKNEGILKSLFRNLGKKQLFGD